MAEYKSQKKPHVRPGSEEEKRYVDELEQQFASVNMHFAEYAKDRLSYEKSLESQKDALHAFNGIYCKSLLALCAVPLRKGVHPTTVLRSAGLFLGCCLFSKTFREGVDKTVRKALYPIVERKAETEGPDSIWAIRRDMMKAQENGGYLPLTPDSAAVLKIAFCQQAYDDMRKPGADINAIMESYLESEALLYKQAKADGIKPETLDRSMHRIVGMMMDKDPSCMKYFTETAYGVVRRGADREYTRRYRDSDGFHEETYFRWDGDMVDADGNPYTRGYTPRVPNTVNEMRKMQRNVWYQAFCAADSPEGIKNIISSDTMVQMQSFYMRMLKEDNGLTDDDVMNVADLDNYISENEDTSWMTDYGFGDPYHSPGASLTFEEYIEHGPGDQVRPDKGPYPEFNSAFGMWLQEHEEYSPGHWQDKANSVYYAATEDGGELSDEDKEQIREYINKREELLRVWSDVFGNASRAQQAAKQRAAEQAEVLANRSKAHPERRLPGEEEAPSFVMGNPNGPVFS